MGPARCGARRAKRVWKAIEELGYFPNRQARALVSGRSRVFGLIVSEITNPFFPEIVQTFETLAVEHNYEILLTSTVHDPKRMELAVRRMIEVASIGRLLPAWSRCPVQRFDDQTFAGGALGAL